MFVLYNMNILFSFYNKRLVFNETFFEVVRRECIKICRIEYKKVVTDVYRYISMDGVLYQM